MPSREEAIWEAKFELGQPFQTPPMAYKLESMLRVELCGIVPRYIVKKCMACGYQSCIALLTRT
eukprot:12926461-Prorocentrum_lima.AAC.1